MRISWERGRDIYGTLMPGYEKTAPYRLSKLLEPQYAFRLEPFADGRPAPTLQPIAASADAASPMDVDIATAAPAAAECPAALRPRSASAAMRVSPMVPERRKRSASAPPRLQAVSEGDAEAPDESISEAELRAGLSDATGASPTLTLAAHRSSRCAHRPSRRLRRHSRRTCPHSHCADRCQATAPPTPLQLVGRRVSQGRHLTHGARQEREFARHSDAAQGGAGQGGKGGRVGALRAEGAPPAA